MTPGRPEETATSPVALPSAPRSCVSVRNRCAACQVRLAETALMATAGAPAAGACRSRGPVVGDDSSSRVWMACTLAASDLVQEGALLN